MDRTATMTHDEAAAILTHAIAAVPQDTWAFVALTTAPDEPQRAAIRSVDQSQPAPLEVSDEMELEAGCTWGAVLREIAFDVGTSVAGEPLS